MPRASTSDAKAEQRANRVKAKLAEVDPWDPEHWAAQEEKTLSAQAPDEAKGVPRREPVEDEGGRRPGLRERSHRR